MATPQGPTSLNTSGIVDGQGIDASDVTIPFAQAATAIDEARTTLAVKETDTVVQVLADAITAGAGITITENTVAGATTLSIAGQGIATGVALPFYGAPSAVPTGFVLADGTAVSMGSAASQTYENFFDLLLAATSYYSTSVYAAFGLNTGNTVTVDAATDKILWAAHTLNDGDRVVFTNSGGTLPGGLAANTKYYVVSAATNDFKVSATEGGAAVDITSAGTGTHTVHWQYNVPDLRGRAFVGLDAMVLGSSANRVTDTAADAMGGTMGEETHTLTEGEMPSHVHQQQANSPSTGSSPDWQRTGSTTNNASGYTISGDTNTSAPNNTISTGGDGAHNNMQPSQFGNWIIKL